MTEIKVLPGGPYVIDSEDLVVIGGDGVARPMVDRPIALCRCGATSSEPLCDGTHTKIGFQRKA